MNPQIEAAKAGFQQSSTQLLKNLAATPDDKLNWSPSPTARTPLEIAFHCAEVISTIHGAIIDPATMPPMSPEQMDSYCRQQEKTPKSREGVTKMIENNAAAYVTWLDELGEEKFGSIWNSPFGDMPVALAITIPAMHTSAHNAQLEYVQTIYGDRVWH